MIRAGMFDMLCQGWIQKIAASVGWTPGLALLECAGPVAASAGVDINHEVAP